MGEATTDMTTSSQPGTTDLRPACQLALATFQRPTDRGQPGGDLADLLDVGFLLGDLVNGVADLLLAHRGFGVGLAQDGASRLNDLLLAQ